MIGWWTSLRHMGAVLVTAPVLLVLADASLARDANLPTADILFIGEQHDNPHHHAAQARYVTEIKPAALVFEMISPAHAASVEPAHRLDPDKLEALLEWETSGWPDFDMYFPIFAAAPEAQIYGASVSREQLRAVVMGEAADGIVGELVARFGLNMPLAPEQQAAREAMQRESHCNALPEDLLPGMVDAQRVRDAALAQAALNALDQTGGPVVVITGNGHARTDWGAPFLVTLAEPEVSVHAIGQGEAGAPPPGVFSSVEDQPSVVRDDPCAAFR